MHYSSFKFNPVAGKFNASFSKLRVFFSFVDLTHFSSNLFFSDIEKGERLHNLKTTNKIRSHSHAKQMHLSRAELQTDPPLRPCKPTVRSVLTVGCGPQQFSSTLCCGDLTHYYGGWYKSSRLKSGVYHT